jgi:hypothetical protein
LLARYTSSSSASECLERELRSEDEQVSESIGAVVVSAGSLRLSGDDVVVMPHRWTPEGVTIQADFTGGHLYHLAAAGCVLNDVYREAERLGITIDGVSVRAVGGFDTKSWISTGIDYDVEIASSAGDEDIANLTRIVDEVAEIPKALRAGTTVARSRMR